MADLILLEGLIGIFYMLALIRPFIKRLGDIKGLRLLPVLALFVNCALFPAYGFRLECLPLLVYGIIVNILNIPMLRSLSRVHDTGFRGWSSPVSALLLVLLVPVLGLGLVFTPGPDTELLDEGVSSLILEDGSGELFLRIYAPQRGAPLGDAPLGDALRPVLVLVPPVYGSTGVVDQVAGELRDRGFTVLSLSRPGFDAPALDAAGRRRGISPVLWYQFFQAHIRGQTTAPANARGRALEEARREDIRLVLSWLSAQAGLVSSPLPPLTAETPVFLAGYSEAGSALLLLAAEPDFAGRYPQVRGLVVLESLLYSGLRGEEAAPVRAALPVRGTVPGEAPALSRAALTGFLEGAGQWFLSLWTGISLWWEGIQPRKISGLGDIPKPVVPVCFVLSDQYRNPLRQNRYRAVLETFRSMEAPAMLVSVSGAGPLDYSDNPGKHPLYAFLFPGFGPDVWGREDYAPGTAALIGGFARSVLDGTGADLGPGVFIETGKGYILKP
ncbi:MAG: hypothetical protein LBT11_02925 [Treponema sp.]|jgi:dienelactone hydrolase|nr:hypothetical protein [Treponema sp.]